MREDLPANLYVIREGNKEDQNFIFATFLRSLYYGNDWSSELDKDHFMENFHLVLESILSRRGTYVRVAALAEDIDVILGYAIIENDCLHYCFVKKAWRKLGVARALVPQDIKTHSHTTTLAEAIKPKHMKLNTYLSVLKPKEQK